MNICTLNKIAACGTDRLAGYTITDELAGAAGVMVRSADRKSTRLNSSHD